MPDLVMNLGENSYNIIIEKGALNRIAELILIDRKVLVVTDKGVPAEYSNKILSKCAHPFLIKLKPGEQSKSPKKYLYILKKMIEFGFDRHDCVVAVGGGVIGDLAGFASATYMRGIDFYNVPTTLLSQVDSSVGGKTAIDFSGYKNIVGSFYQPKKVVIDPDVLKTLDKRQFSCGMAEIIKMFATYDKDSFEKLYSNKKMPVEELIERALKVKIDVVSKDEKESGLRRVLNFGHTVGHAVESVSASTASPLLHGECVALGMLCMSGGDAKKQIMNILERYNLPTSYKCSKESLVSALAHDKKSKKDTVSVVKVNKIGTFEITEETHNQIISDCKGVLTLL
ncbi:MAG: 3-dehydroquinate synthase [Clostridiales bacterium]|nr:3-dehydroquinate synthase [Clostridiales bacterium]